MSLNLSNSETKAVKILYVGYWDKLVIIIPVYPDEFDLSNIWIIVTFGFHGKINCKRDY